MPPPNEVATWPSAVVGTYPAVSIVTARARALWWAAHGSAQQSSTVISGNQR
jgi:hypothetical protein